MPQTTRITPQRDVLQPEPKVEIRPQMTQNQARVLVEQLYGLKVIKVKELGSYVDRNYHVTVSPEHSNKHVKEVWPHGYVLKVLNSKDTLARHVEAEHVAQRRLLVQGWHVPSPESNLQGEDMQLVRIHNKHMKQQCINNNDLYVESPYSDNLVRLLRFVPGIMIMNVPYTPGLLYKLGCYIGGLDGALEGLQHPTMENYPKQWSIPSVAKLDRYLHAVYDENNADIIRKVIRAFQDEVLPISDLFQKGVIHGDCNQENILVKLQEDDDGKSEADTYSISGIIDFGHLRESCYLYELVIAIMYMMVSCKPMDPLEVGGHLLAGYLTKKSLNESEFDALKVCVAGRIAQSLAIGAYAHSLEPGNSSHLGTATSGGWDLLRRLWDTPKDTLYAKWKDIIKSYQC